MIGLMCVVQAEPPKQKIRAFHIGNSLTFGEMSGLSGFMGSRGSTYEYGWHVLWGKGLSEIWEKSGAPSDKAAKYGAFKDALANNEWDVLTLQSWGAVFEGEKGDVVMAKKFIELALKKSPDLQVYIYETWPFKDKAGKIDFAAKWAREFPKPGQWDSVYNSTYCKVLVDRLNKDMPDLKKPVRLIPAGSVISELDKQARAGTVPGIKQIEELYKDDIHMGPAGVYLVRCVFYSVIMKDNPVGLPGAGKDVPDELSKIFQETAWKVVGGLEMTGAATAKDSK